MIIIRKYVYQPDNLSENFESIIEAEKECKKQALYELNKHRDFSVDDIFRNWEKIKEIVEEKVKCVEGGLNEE